MAEGRTRSVSIPWPEVQDHKANNIREWFTFKLVHRGNLGRYEQEYQASSKAEIATAYRLMNADGLYKLDGNMMYISPHTEDDENSWANLDGSMLPMSEVFNGR